MALWRFDRRRDQSVEGLNAGRRNMAETAGFPCLKRWRKTGRKEFGYFQFIFQKISQHGVAQIHDQPCRSG